MGRKKIVITGTTGGIGSAVRKAAEASGYEVVEVNRSDFAILETIDALNEGGVDAVVFASGFCPVKPVPATDDLLFEETVGVNAGLFLKLMRFLLKGKLYNPRGMTAIAVSSVSAVEGWPGGAAYCASKGALSAMCRAMDAELRPKNIRVTAIEPRYVKTPMFDNCAGRMGVDPSLALDPAVLADEIISSIGKTERGGGAG